MKISILSPNISNNCVGRSYIFAKILQKHFEVEIVGPAFANSVWEPIANEDITFKYVNFSPTILGTASLNKIYNLISGDIIFANKPLLTSFGIGLLQKKFKKKKLILDIDDYEMGFARWNAHKGNFFDYMKYYIFSMIYPYHTISYYNNFVSEKMIKYADEIIVSNSFLQNKYGGTIIWHGRDTDTFDPKKFDNKSLRLKYKIDANKIIVMFMGTILPYKGLDDLIDAVGLLNKDNVSLVIVGADKEEINSQRIVQKAKEQLKSETVFFNKQPFNLIPEFIAMADVVVIPQRDNPATVGQMPAKIFDAMAMAKPIVSTSVSDIPAILDGCGYVVKPDAPNEIAQAISDIIINPEKARTLGEKAREKCIEKYSWNSIEKEILNIFNKYKE